MKEDKSGKENRKNTKSPQKARGMSRIVKGVKFFSVFSVMSLCLSGCFGDPLETALDDDPINYLKILDSMPGNGDVGVPVYSDIVIIFNRDIEEDSISYQSEAGSCEGALQISSDDFDTCQGIAGVGIERQEIVVSINAMLNSSDNYKIRVLSRVTDTDGNPMKRDYVQDRGFYTE